MQRESIVGRRIYACFFDGLILFVFIFFVEGIITKPIFENITNISEVQELYEKHSKEYEKIQDEYEIYLYDSDNNRYYNNKVTEEKKNQFLIDSRVTELNTLIVEEQNTLLGAFIFRITISIFICWTILQIILPFFLGKGQTIGKKIAKIVVCDENLHKINPLIFVLRSLLSLIINCLLGIFSLGIFPLINLVVSILKKDDKTIEDLICKTRVEDVNLLFSL